MQNTNTTYFLSDYDTNLCPLNELQADTFEIRTPMAPALPASYLKKMRIYGEILFIPSFFLSSLLSFV